MLAKEKCTICRREKTKLFLKGERCLSPKCAITRKPYAPGNKSKRRFKTMSEYGKELQEKQKLKNWYNLRERQFSNYVKKVLEDKKRAHDAPSLLIERLEKRLDSVVYRLGFASSHAEARQLVSHNHFLVNDKSINVPSYGVKKGDVVKVKPKSLKKVVFEKLQESLKKYNPPKWLELNAKAMEGKVVGAPSLAEMALPIEISSIFEYYSR